MAAPLNARFGYSSRELQHTLERSIELAGSLGRTGSKVSGMVALWGTQFVQGRTAEGYLTATRALALAEPGSELSGVAHFGVGGSSISLGMPAEGLRHLRIAAELASDAVSLSIGTRPRVHGTAWSAHAHWLLGDDDAALSASRDAIELARSLDHPYNLAVALAYASITYQMRHREPAAPEAPGAGEAPVARGVPDLRSAVEELRELCERYAFAYYREWALILDGWSRMDGSGIALARQGIDNLKAEGSFARMPYWLSLLADLLARNGQPSDARAILDAALAGAKERDDLWWLPEVMRMRAAYDGGRRRCPDCTPPRRWRLATAVSRCCGAANGTSSRGAPGPRRAAFCRPPDPNALRERSANARRPSVGVSPSPVTYPKGEIA